MTRRVPVVTTLTRPAEERARLRRYLITMSIAVGLFVSSPFLPGVLQVVVIAVAAVLPPLAAIMANAPSLRRRRTAAEPVVEGSHVRDPKEQSEHRVIDPDR